MASKFSAGNLVRPKEGGSVMQVISTQAAGSTYVVTVGDPVGSLKRMPKPTGQFSEDKLVLA